MSQQPDLCSVCYVMTRYHLCRRKDCPRKPESVMPSIDDLPIPLHPKLVKRRKTVLP